MVITKAISRKIVAVVAFLFMVITARAGNWDFDVENVMVSGELRYVVDTGMMAAQCVGLKEGSTATVITVPATVSLSGKNYDVVSIGILAFSESHLVEAYLLSPSIEIGIYAFPVTLCTLHMSAVVPPRGMQAPFLSVALNEGSLTVYVPGGCADAYVAADEVWASCLILEEEEYSYEVTLTKPGVLRDRIRTLAGGFNTVNNLKVNGPINADDISLMRDSLKMLLSLDLTDAECRSLPERAFYLSRFKSIKLPRTLEVIGKSAFENNPNLYSVVVPEGVTRVENNAFSGCKSLRWMDLPSTLTYIYDIVSIYNYNTEPVTPGDALVVTFRGMMPPTRYSSNPFYVYGIGLKFQIPAIAVDNYRDTDLAYDYELIPMDDILPQTITVQRDFTLDTDLMPDGYHPNIWVTREATARYYDYPFAVLTLRGTKPLKASKVTIENDLSYTRFMDYYTSSVIKSNGLLSADEVKVRLVTMSGKWMFLSFPFDVKVKDIVTDKRIKHWVIRSYSSRNRAQGYWQQWVDVPASGTLNANQGYIWYATVDDQLPVEYYEESTYADDIEIDITADAQAQAALLGNAEASLPLTAYGAEFAHNENWNFLGNPYPAYYDIRQLSLTMPVYVWNSRSEIYKVYSPLDDEVTLSPYEAFFIQKPKDADVLRFPLSGLCPKDGTEDTYSAPLRFAPASDRRLIDLRLTVGDRNDDVRLVLNESASEQYETGRDAVKMFSLDSSAPQVYTLVGDVPCAINERPMADGVVALGISMGESGSATLALQRGGNDTLLLIDRLTGLTTDLNAGNYTFTAEKGNTDGRFLLCFSANATGMTDAVLKNEGSASAAYNLSGQKVDDDYRGLVIINGNKYLRK